MANLTETPVWEAGVYQLETTDPVLGGPGGISNSQAQALANRTAYLKDAVDTLQSDVSSLETASAVVQRIKGAAALVKQGVVTCRRDVNGIVDFINIVDGNPSAGGTINILANSASPLVLSFCAGYDADGPIVYYGYVNSNQVELVGNNTSQLLYAELNPTTGAISFDVTPYVAPVVSYTEPAHAENKYWFNLRNSTMYLSNGTTWTAVIRVLLCQVSFGGSGSFTLYPTIGIGAQEIYGRSAVPAGSVSAFAGATAPTGYMLCDGSAVSRSIYSELFQAIGTTYGVGDNSTTFNLPDLRGEFIRGLDGGRGIDLNSVSKTASITNGSPNVTVVSTIDLAVGMTVTGTGIPVGATIASITSSTVFVLSANATATNGSVALTMGLRFLGSFQFDEFASHRHIMKKFNRSIGTGAGFFAMDDNGTDGSENTELTGGAETRPRNVAMNYIIKF